MAQLWGGRFTKQTDQLVFDFNASITFDKRLFHEDVTGSIVHATMLAKQGILTEEERKSIIEGLTGILEDVDAGKLTIDETQEDIHSFVEATLIDRIGLTFFSNHSVTIQAVGVVLGSLLYRIIIQIAYKIDMPSYAVKLLSAVIVVIALVIPWLQKTYKKKGGRR